MPRESSRLIRPSKILNAEKFFIIASEGEVTERKYFNQLSDSNIFNKVKSKYAILNVHLETETQYLFVGRFVKSRKILIIDPQTSYG